MATTTNFTAKDVAELRARTGAGMMDCKKALEESGGDIDKAVEYLRRKGVAKAEKRADRAVKEGYIGHYLHHNGKVAVLVELNCETDFVARTDDFKNLARSLAEHVAALAPIAVDRDQVPPDRVEQERRIFEDQVRQSGKPANMIDKIVEGMLKKHFAEKCLLDQPFIKNPDQTVQDYIKEHIAKLGENIIVRRFHRVALGEVV
jgi:elongation factor Ts